MNAENCDKNGHLLINYSNMSVCEICGVTAFDGYDETVDSFAEVFEKHANALDTVDKQGDNPFGTLSCALIDRIIIIKTRPSHALFNCNTLNKFKSYYVEVKGRICLAERTRHCEGCAKDKR